MATLKSKKVAGFLLVAFVITAALIKWVSKIGEEPLLKDRPDAAHAFQVLYEAPSPTTKFSPDKTHLATVWFEQEINDGVSDLYVVFSKKQEVDEHGELVSCHACPADIDAITYMRKADGWAKVATQKSVAQIGSWGNAPAIKSAKTLLLTTGNLVLPIPLAYSGQGITNRVEILLNYYQGRWADIGYLDLAGDNLGSSCKTKDEPPSADPTYDSPCYSYKSTYKLVSGDNISYPNILVSRRGLGFSTETGSVEKVGDELYVFDGKNYLSSRQKQDNARRDTQQTTSTQKENTSNVESSNGKMALVGIIFLVVGGIGIYFLPAIVATFRNHHQANAIAILNLFLGWTLLGWVIALVWSATAIPKQTVVQSTVTDTPTTPNPSTFPKVLIGFFVFLLLIVIVILLGR